MIACLTVSLSLDDNQEIHAMINHSINFSMIHYLNLLIDSLWVVVMSRSPIFREIAMALGVINVHRDSCKFVLTQQGPGHSVVIAIGGTCDILNMNRDSYVITLERRKGFVQLALETG